MNGFERWFTKLQFGYKKRVKFYREFAGLLGADMSKPDALYNLYMVASRDGVKKNAPMALVIDDIRQAMKNGERFGPALRAWVPSDDAMVIEASENSDDFGEQLKNYTETVAKKRKIRSTIIGGLIYPLIMMLMIYGLLIYFGLSVVPEVGKLLTPDKWEGPAAFLAFLGDFARYYAVPIAGSFVTLLVIVSLSLPRWAANGRKFADRLPLYSMYRMYTGISFLLGVSALMRGGMPAMGAVDRLRLSANNYVRTRINLITGEMLNGETFGSALAATGTGWPDPDLNLSIKVFSKGRDLAEQMAHMSGEWLDQAQENISARMATFQNLSLALTFCVIISVVVGMYSLQSQIATAVQASAY
jgi:type II secretory pathway component PulF